MMDISVILTIHVKNLLKNNNIQNFVSKLHDKYLLSKNNCKWSIFYKTSIDETQPIRKNEIGITEYFEIIKT